MFKRVIFILIIVSFTIPILNGEAKTEEIENRKTRIAILPFSGRGNIDSELLEILSENFAVSVIEIGEYTVVERNLLSKALDELKMQRSSIFDDNLAAEVGKLVGAEVIVVGSVSVLGIIWGLFGNSYHASVRGIEVETGIIRFASKTNTNDERKIVEIVDQLAENISNRNVNKRNLLQIFFDIINPNKAKERKETARLEKERQKITRLEQEKLLKEKEKKEQLEKEKQEIAKLEQEKLAKEKEKREQLEKEKQKIAKLEKERATKDRERTTQLEKEKPVHLRYDEVGSFSNGLARVRINNKYGYIDEAGREVVAAKYDFEGGFRDGLASVRLNTKWGIVDRAGKEIIPVKYDSVISFRDDGFARVELNGKLGFVDKSGREIAPAKYDALDFYPEGFIAVRIGRSWGIVDKTGREVVSIECATVDEARQKLY
jgi:hypothetical protein